MSKEVPANEASAQITRGSITETLDTSRLPDSVRAESEREGGSVSGLPPTPEEHPRDVERRGWLAIALFCLLSAILLFHYGTVVIFLWKGKTQDEIKGLDGVFNSALPVVSGFFGTAVAFYFKDRGR